MVKPLVNVMIPPITHAAIAMVVVWALAKMEDCLKNIPEPIIVPITNDNAEYKPSER